jgi:hypothetical protein
MNFQTVDAARDGLRQLGFKVVDEFPKKPKQYTEQTNNNHITFTVRFHDGELIMWLYYRTTGRFMRIET